MKALGKGSIASWVRIALLVALVILWITAIALGIFVVCYVGALIGIQMGWLPPNILEVGHATVDVGPVTIRSESDQSHVVPIIGPALIAAVIAVAGAFIIVLRLRQLFKNFTSGEAFSADNATHLRVIWITMLVLELSRYVIGAVITVLVSMFGRPEVTHIEIKDPINFMTWGAILILIVLAEVFREGARLKQEQELTI
jgi:hypothetical protein